MNKFLAAGAVAFVGIVVSVTTRWPVLRVVVTVQSPAADIGVFVEGREVASARGADQQTVRFRSPQWTPPTHCTVVIRRVGRVTHRIRSVPFRDSSDGLLATVREEVPPPLRRPITAAVPDATENRVAATGSSPLPDILRQLNTLSDSELRSAFARAQRYALERRAAGDALVAHRAEAVVRLLEGMFRHKRRAETVRLLSPGSARPASLLGPDWKGRNSEDDDVALP